MGWMPQRFLLMMKLPQHWWKNSTKTTFFEPQVRNLNTFSELECKYDATIFFFLNRSLDEFLEVVDHLREFLGVVI